MPSRRKKQGRTRHAETGHTGHPERAGTGSVSPDHEASSERARMIEASAQGDSNAQIARELDVNVDTVRLWRDRWVGLQGIELATRSRAERLRDALRPGTPPKFTAEQRCQMAALACEAPMERGIVEQISPRHASYLLKKGVCNRTASDTG